jgi:outer membrane protein assembly factor BamB
LVDSQSNVYFWSGQFNLHSLDKEGSLRWRHDLCTPKKDAFCNPESCDPGYGIVVPTVLDYYDTLYFYVGDELFVISRDGGLVEREVVQIPGLEVPGHSSLYIANGVRHHSSNIFAELAGAATLTSDGRITAAYFVSNGAASDEFIAPTGTVTVSRRGGYLSSFDTGWKTDLMTGFSFQSRVTELDDERYLFMGAATPLPREYDPDRTGFIAQIEESSLSWSHPLHRDFEVPGSPPFDSRADRIVSQPAVSPNGRAYALSFFGVVYALDLDRRELRRLMNFQSEGVFSWYNRPVVDAEGTLYFIQNHAASGSTLWAIDPEVLWEQPLTRADLSETFDHPGIKWTVSHGPHGGGMGTPAIAADGTIYAPMNGLAAIDPDTGEEIWRFGSLTMGSSPTILPDGTIVVGQSSRGQVFFLRENVNNGGLAQEGWPQAHRDYYHSNNANHPFVWDRSEPPPYPADPSEKPADESGCQAAPAKASVPVVIGGLVAFLVLVVWRRRSMAGAGPP